VGSSGVIRTLRVASVALVVAGLISAVAVGGSTKKAGAQKVATVTNAPDAVANAGTVTIKLHFHGSGGGGDADFDGVEYQDFANHRSSAQMTLPAPLGDLNIVVAGNTVYFQTRNTTTASGDPGWWQVNVAEGALPGGTDEPIAGVPNGRDYLAYLRNLSGDVTDEGDTEIDGVVVHHYRAAVDLSKAFSNAGLDAQQDQLAQLEQQGVHLDAEMDAFIDDNGLPRRVTMKISAEGFSFDVRLDFVDYGAPVDIVEPPAEQVVETRDVNSVQEFILVSQEIGQRLAAGG
jgi:hypothetical protein